MPALIYVVDDEPNIRRLCSIGLRDAGYETQEFSSGADLLAALRYKKPEAVILDWMMPQPDGVTVCRLMREDEATRAVPIIMLTARGEEADKILGLEVGADDFVVKPFSVRELVARVRAVIRRKEYMMPQEDSVIACGPFVLDIPKRRLEKNGKPVELTLKEFDLLSVLMKNRGKVLNRDVLLNKVWGMDFYGDPRTVDVHIRFLRQKIEDDPDSPKYIETLRGVGYRFSDIAE